MKVETQIRMEMLKVIEEVCEKFPEWNCPVRTYLQGLTHQAEETKNVEEPKPEKEKRR